MIYRCVEDRIAVSLRRLQLPIGNQQALEILRDMGFVRIRPNGTVLARSLVGKSEYRRGARPEQAPNIVDCSSMVKWIYGQMGIWLPRYTIDQRESGRVVSRPREADLVFNSGWRSYYWNDPSDGVGHVGIVSDSGTVIHAANRKLGVIESPWEQFFSKKEKFRGLRRFLPQPTDLLTLKMTKRKVETSQELRWVILQRL